MVVEFLLEFINQELLDFLKLKGIIFFIMNILLDRYRINDLNKRGFYNYFFVICIVGIGNFVFFNLDVKNSRLDFVWLCFYSLVEIVVLERGI